ncbi:MAG: MurR/RpiR family transcriptional regulator, partial [Neofamilia sp.]
ALLDSIKYTLTTLQRLDVSRELGENELIHSQINSDVNDINATFTNLDPTVIMNAAKEIDRSKKIFILGLRTSNFLTQYLAHYLRMMTFDVVLVEGTFMEPYEYLVNMKSEDILICISLPRYSQRTIQSVKLIHNKGYRIISLTDSESSPIFNFSSISLIARCSMNSFFDSMVSPLVIINTLLLSISAVTSRDVEGSFKELEEFWEKSRTYERI